VSRKIGGAVVRNRIKRMFREIFRRSWDEIPNDLDIVVIAKSGCFGVSYSELRTEFLNAAQKLNR
jgi:ribonuclease P protein component